MRSPGPHQGGSSAPQPQMLSSRQASCANQRGNAGVHLGLCELGFMPLGSVVAVLSCSQQIPRDTFEDGTSDGDQIIGEIVVWIVQRRIVFTRSQA